MVLSAGGDYSVTKKEHVRGSLDGGECSVLREDGSEKFTGRVIRVGTKDAMTRAAKAAKAKGRPPRNLLASKVFYILFPMKFVDPERSFHLQDPISSGSPEKTGPSDVDNDEVRDRTD